MDQSVSDNRATPIKDEIVDAYTEAAATVNYFLYNPNLRSMRYCQQTLGYLSMVADKPIKKFYKDDAGELLEIEVLINRNKKLRTDPENDLGWAKTECNDIVEAYYKYLIDANIIRT